MLKLLNNEEITDKIKEAFKKNLTKAKLLNNNLEITPENYLMSLEYKDEKYNPDKGFIGEAVCRSIDIKLNNKDNALDLENQDLEYRIGAKLDDGTFKYISFGNFIVQKPENTDVKEETTFTALDYMSKFDKPYEQRLTLPMTYGALAQDICDQCGVELGSIEFRNSNKTVLTNPFIGGENCREVIKSLARISFSVAYIGQDNKLYFGFEVKNEVDEEIDTDEYFELSPNNRKKPINVVTLRSSEVPAAGISIKNQAAIDAMGEEVELIIEEDYFAYTDEIREDLLKEATALFGLEYDPIEIDLLGSIYLNFNDVIEVTNLKGEKRKTYCINNSHTYNGALYNKIASPALTEVEDKYKYQDEAETARRRTAVEIDKANQRINLLTTNVTEQQNKISQIIIDIDTIRNEVSNIVDTTHQLSDANGYIFIEDAIEGELYELHILGNNTVFQALYPDENLYPNEDLYPKDGRAELTKYTAKNLQEGIEYINASILEDGTYNTTLGGKYSLVIPIKENKKYTVFREIGNTFTLATYADEELTEGSIATNYIRGKSSELSIETKENDKYLVLYFYDDNLADKDLETIYNSIKIYENYEVVYLGFNGTLRQLNGIYDEYVLYNGKAKIIRRINENGTAILANSYEEDLGELHIELYQDHNYITINPEIATIVLKYVRQNEFSNIYATKIEMNSKIEMTTQSINLEVSKKLDDTKVEMYSAIQQLSDEINLEVGQKVNEDEIIASLNVAVEKGKGIIVLKGNTVIIDSDNFKLNSDGYFQAIYGKIGKWNLNTAGLLYGAATVNNKRYESGLDTRDNNYMLYAGLDITDGATHNLSESNAYITKSGLMKAKWFNVNGESGYFHINYDSGRTSLILNKSGISSFLDNQNNNNFYSILADGSHVWMHLADALSFTFTDDVHGQIFARFMRYDPDQSAENSRLGHWCNFYSSISVLGNRQKDSIRNTIFIQGYEVATNASDKRLKENIKDSTSNALEIVNNIKIRKFDWKKDKHLRQGGQHINNGFIAQEVQKIDDTLVNYNKENDTYQMDVLNLVALQMKAIQELDAKVQKQQKIIDFLINKLDCKEELEEYLKGE